VTDRLFDQQFFKSAEQNSMERPMQTADVEQAAAVEQDAVLRLEGVQKSYGNNTVVENADLALQRGEILTLLGPSGCGKTTTLRIAIGLERASRGKVIFNGKLVDGPAQRVFVPPEKRNMGMVFQSYAIWPHMTVAENVAYPLSVRRRDPADIKVAVDKILQLVGLAGYEDRPGTQLSGGQQQRVAVARGLVYGPDLLLMDEPFSNLDVKLREQMRVEVKLLQRRLGISILFVTHDQSEALALSDRIGMMRGGRIEQIGSPLELYTAPQTPYVRDFLGRTLLFPGTILARETNGVTAVRLDDGTVIRAAGTDKTQGAPVNSRCVLGIRPEQAQVEPDLHGSNPAGNERNAVRGKILALLFLGERYEAEVQLSSNITVTVYLPPTYGWRENQAVCIVLSESALQLWPAED
jgi:ABC-type Fe3+/spermidine/putrescine transport system ATPase subunit